jgi:hypothetical protein
MIHARCKDGQRGILVLAGHLQKVAPGWSGLVDLATFERSKDFLEPFVPPAQEVGRPPDPFRSTRR